jgi:hypothetical protein
MYLIIVLLRVLNICSIYGGPLFPNATNVYRLVLWSFVQRVSSWYVLYAASVPFCNHLANQFKHMIIIQYKLKN